MTKDAWVANHPYLRSLADLQTLVDTAATEVCIPTASAPRWNDYIDNFHAGVPLLLSLMVRIDLQPVAEALASLAEILLSRRIPEKLVHETRELIADLRSDPRLRQRVVGWLLEKDPSAPRHPGLVHYLGWTVMARYLQQLVTAFGQWRNEERWLRNYCPMCGAPPAMAQLVGNDPARLRLFSCGRCATRWRYQRTGCPFCETVDDRRLAFLAVEGEDALRIDYCESCGGYLKTYIGEGNEGVLLADWTSLHLDVIAQDHGLRHYAASLYDQGGPVDSS
jgi:FdhE protein